MLPRSLLRRALPRATTAATTKMMMAPARASLNATSAMCSASLARAMSTAAKSQARVAAPVSRAMSLAARVEEAPAKMFCFQCEQTSGGSGCTTVGVCGKEPHVAAMQDLLVEQVKAIGQLMHVALSNGAKNDAAVDRFVLVALFSTVTNVNFDGARIAAYIHESVRMRERALKLALSTPGGAAAVAALGGPAATLKVSATANEAELTKIGEQNGLLARQARSNDSDDVVGLREMATYGLKGAAAYAEHASTLGKESPDIFAKMHGILATLANPASTGEELLGASLRVGALNLDVMALLDAGHTGRFGHPVPTQVRTHPVEGKCILVSGHDLIDLEGILKACEGTDVKVYTHGEMLPAHAYPKLREYKALAGHFGGPWQLQKFELPQFPGPVVFTSNCLVEPRKSYASRVYTRNMVGFPGIKHIDGVAGEAATYAAVVRHAQQLEGFDADDASAVSKPLLTGFGHNAVMGVAGKVIDAVKAGAISHFFLIGGCDGSEGERSYYTELAKQSPKDSVLLTLGCGKYRLNRLELGNIGDSGLPRVMDMGQCNDSFSAIQVAVALANAFKTDVNGLPLSFALSWFEQKAVAVLCTLLHLGVRNIRIGPALPGFATPGMLKVLNDAFNLRPITSASADLKDMMQNK